MIGITFTRTTTVYDESTGLATPTETTITGAAMRIPGDPSRYAAGGWSLATMPTLMFVATTYGPEVVVAGDTVVWGGVTYTAKSVEPFAPDPWPIFSTIVVGV